MENPSHPFVARVVKLSSVVKRSALEHWVVFLRFRVLRLTQGSVMTAVYQPRNKVAALIMPHFSDRFHEDNFAIWDKTHDVAGVHPEGGGAREWFLVEHFQQDHPDMVLKMFTEDAEEKDLEHMWKTFCETTDIAERKNTNLQRNLIPLYFRGNMTEFTE